MRGKVGLLAIVLLFFVGIWTDHAQASPSYQSTDISVRVCYDNTTCRTPTRTGTDLTTLNIYTEQVLANEWHPQAGLEALKAGAIAIRTFTNRGLGCGAYWGEFLETPGPPPMYSRVLDNRSQAYAIGGRGGQQNPITPAHTDARSQTDYMFLYRTDGGFACAKYNTTATPPKLVPAVTALSQETERHWLPQLIQ